ncbi:MAG: CYTH domain-containing protein, partial [Pseudomonadota bacterium]
MATEIERKFLVRGNEWRTLSERQIDIQQAYLANTPRSSIRIRLAADEASLNLKSTKSLVEREEFEYSIPYVDAQEMLDTLAISQVISKTRHYLRFAKKQWEVDEFRGANKGLNISEIELNSI